MNPETPPPEPSAETAAPAETAATAETAAPAATAVEVEAPPPKKLIDPTLSGTLAADHAALQNDLVQAQELASDFQRQLAGKSNEYAQLKQLLEKTTADLAHLQGGIVQLRAERHHLANEVMRGQAFEMRAKAFERKLEEQTAQLQERDRRIAQLVIQTAQLRTALNEAQRHGGGTPRPMTREDIKLVDDMEIEITPEAPRPLRMVRQPRYLANKRRPSFCRA